ncbi:flagellar hook-associated protein FlgK [uncultured Aquabacterium sp.]|uniref:flagellar hook-associated protein FlgK n=1 Tax=Aquabacterium sp. TaxID=1872578 RepID=UPI0025F78069|nr:flagellar hook-associated protein FlgK [uncultured Aquabacterium sp.]
MGSGIFALSTRAMFANQAMLDTTAHNISNVNTPGYSRQKVELSTEGGMYTGAGFFGRGVKVTTITRSTNEFLIKSANEASAAASADKTRLDKLEQLETVLPTGETGLGYAATQLLNAFVDVANQPQDMSARQVVLSRAEEWASRIRSSAQQIEQLQAGVISDLGTDIKQINDYAKQIARLNQDIASAKGTGQPPNDLMDRRDEVITRLNKLVQVNTVEADDGSLSVFMGGGQLLVLSNQAQELALMQGTNADGITVGAVGIVTANSLRQLDDSQLVGGGLRGLLDFQNKDLASTRKDLNDFASSFAAAINTQQQLGILAKKDAAGNVLQGNALFTGMDKAITVRVNLQNPQDIAAASPLVAYTADTNRGTMSVDSLTMNAPSGRALPATPLTLTFQTPATGSGFNVVDGSGNLIAANWLPGQNLVFNDAGGAALFTQRITGVPEAGDSITIEPPVDPSGNNGNARGMLELRDRNLISLSSNGSVTTVTNAYSQMIGNLGVLVQSGRTASSISSALDTQATQTLEATRGVNLDEEAARLIQFQQSYQAAAKVLQVAQKVFDTLLNVSQ